MRRALAVLFPREWWIIDSMTVVMSILLYALWGYPAFGFVAGITTAIVGNLVVYATHGPHNG